MPAAQWEQTGTAVTSCYYAEAGAMRRAGYATSNGGFYLRGDQINSTSAIRL